MKKVLLTTTAFAALVNVNTTNAMAHEAGSMQVETNGFVKFMAGYVDHRTKNVFGGKDRTGVTFVDSTNTSVTRSGSNRHMDFLSDAEVIIRAKGQTADGLEFGATVELEANPATKHYKYVSENFSNGMGTSSTYLVRRQVTEGSGSVINADKMYIWMEHEDLGRVIMGNRQGAADDLHYFAPAHFATGGIDGQYSDFLGDELVPEFYKAKDSVDDLKVQYITPRVEGFQASISLAPVSAREGRFIKRQRVSLVPLGTTTLMRQSYENVLETGLNYINTFGEVGVAASGAYVHATPLRDIATTSRARTHKDWNSMAFGLNVMYQGLVVGGSYVNNFKTGYAKVGANQKNEHGFSAGIEYETGSFLFGINGGHFRTVTDTTVLGSTARSTVVSGGVTYKAHKGLNFFYEGTSVDRKAQAGNKSKGHLHLVGSKVAW